MNVRKTTRQMLAVLLCAVVAVSALLPITAFADEPQKTVRVGWFGAPFCPTAAAATGAMNLEQYFKSVENSVRTVSTLVSDSFEGMPFEDLDGQVERARNLSKPVEPDHLYQTLGELIWEAENQSDGAGT